jgi:hypothetical protein
MLSLYKYVNGFSMISRLLLDNNKLSDDGAKYLSLALPRMTELVELNISFNEISGMGLLPVVKSIQSLSCTVHSLRKLWLSGNTIDNDVAKALAKLLLSNSYLIALYMDHSLITSMGERFIGTGIASNPHSALRIVTGIELSKVLVLLGSAPQIAELSNEAALRFLVQMWQHAEKSSMSLARLSLVDAIEHDLVKLPPVISAEDKETNMSEESDDDAKDYDVDDDNGDYDCVQDDCVDDDGVAEISNNQCSDPQEDNDDDGRSDNESTLSLDFDELVEVLNDSDNKVIDRIRENTKDVCQLRIPNSLSAKSLQIHSLSQPQSHLLINNPLGHSSQPPATTNQCRTVSFGEFRYSDEKDREKQKEHRLRTYIVNPDVLDVARKLYTIPFSAGELWELQQFYYSPPPTTEREREQERTRQGGSSCGSGTGMGDTDLDDCGERPKKKPSNRNTMAKINLYSRIKVCFLEIDSTIFTTDVGFVLFLGDSRGVQGTTGRCENAFALSAITIFGR